jgi:2-polyprenyl-3-methyl-5-hydroxy-6-metoxy-1,4-benzoquinol methylase
MINENIFNERENYGNFESNIIFLNNLNLFNKDIKILEIGCGRGALINYFFKKGHDIQGIEIRKELINEAHKLHITFFI